SELFQSWLLERLRLSSTAHNNEQGQILSNIFHPMCALLAVLRRRAPQGVPDLPAGFYVFKMSPAGFHWSLSSNRAKIAYIISYLTGRARSWAIAEWSHRSTVCKSLSEFLDTFKQIFQSTNLSWDNRPQR
uniref:DUF4939 domain-containing protein n=1 Tax=Mola mola TaxID=94237 RepID=A0A3Q3X409_MOLML